MQGRLPQVTLLETLKNFVFPSYRVGLEKIQCPWRGYVVSILGTIVEFGDLCPCRPPAGAPAFQGLDTMGGEVALSFQALPAISLYVTSIRPYFLKLSSNLN